jgi:hypothetical protein
MNKRVLQQLIYDFWPQAIISILWAGYRSYLAKEDNFSVFVTNFFPAFFLTSWMYGQVIRIKKQQKLEDEFERVKSEISKLLENIQQQTDYLIGHATGGDSIGYFSPSVQMGTMNLTFDFMNLSKYPVFDIFAEWIDLDERIDPANKVFWTRNRIVLGTIHANKVAVSVFGFDMTTRDRLRINIFMQTRNRSIIQLIRVEKVNGQLKFALKTQSDIFNETRIPEDFPNYIPEEPDKVFQ